MLLVDDQPEVRRALAGLLNRMNASVLAASTGEQALELAQTCSFQSVLTDYELPGIRGIELVRALRDTQPLARIVLMTGAGLTDGEREALREAGVDSFLVKPLGNDDLRALLHRAI